MSVTIEDIAERMQDMGLIRLNKIINSYYSGYCPIHNGGQERKPSFGILLHDEYRNGQLYKAGWCHCFSCQISMQLPELITEILKSKSISMSGLDWLKANVPGFNAEEADFDYLIPNDLFKSLNSKYALDYIQSLTQKKKNVVPESELEKYRYTVQYMFDRKLTMPIIEKYDVGVDVNWVPEGRTKPIPCITFPIKDENGDVVYIYRRSIEGKFFAAPKSETKPVYGLWELPKDCKSVFIVESCFNCLTLEVWGYNAVALLGTGTPYQIEKLRRLGVSEFIICTDGDDAGRRSAKKLKRNLKDVAIVWTVNMPQGKDVNDCTYEEFEELLKSKE